MNCNQSGGIIVLYPTEACVSKTNTKIQNSRKRAREEDKLSAPATTAKKKKMQTENGQGREIKREKWTDSDREG